MKYSHIATAVSFLWIFVVLGTVTTADWPQMAGPDRNNISSETGLARTWPGDGPPVLWTVALGGGFASPSIKDGKVYLLDRIGAEQDNLRCFDLETGQELWNYSYDAPGGVSHDGPRTAPTVTEDRVYFVGMLGHFTCLDLATHKPVWTRNLCADFGAEVPRWGVAQAPSLYKDMVIVAPQANDAFVAAIDKNTGEVVWKTPCLGDVGYSTPVMLTWCSVDQAVMIGATPPPGLNTGSVNGISLENGSVLWSYHGWECKIPIPYATALPDNRLFITGGYKAGSAMVQLNRDGDAFTVKELFKTEECGSQIQQPIFFQNHLYVNSNSNEREDGMMCLTLDGKILWKTRDTRIAWFSTTFERGPLLLADGLILNLDGKYGTLHLIEPSPEGYKELAKATVLEGKQLWSPMALSRGRLLIRSHTEMKCLKVGTP